VSVNEAILELPVLFWQVEFQSPGTDFKAFNVARWV